MYLLIDPSGAEQVAIYYCLDTKWVQRNFLWSDEGGLLGAVNRILSDLNKTLPDLKGIAVVIGKGRFTATRVAVTVANTLAFALHIPVAVINTINEAEIVGLIEGQPKGRLIHASYSGEARIGVKSSSSL